MMVREPEVIARVEDKSIPDSSTDILPEDVSVRSAGEDLVLVVALDTDTTISRIVTLSDGSTTKEAQLNEGNTLNGANNEFNFELISDPKHTYNFQVGASCTVEYLTVKRLPKGVE